MVRHVSHVPARPIWTTALSRPGSGVKPTQRKAIGTACQIRWIRHPPMRNAGLAWWFTGDSQTPPRHCERSEAIHLAACRMDGLPRRFAPRNDGVGALANPACRSRTWLPDSRLPRGHGCRFRDFCWLRRRPCTFHPSPSPSRPPPRFVPCRDPSPRRHPDNHPPPHRAHRVAPPATTASRSTASSPSLNRRPSPTACRSARCRSRAVPRLRPGHRQPRPRPARVRPDLHANSRAPGRPTARRRMRRQRIKMHAAAFARAEKEYGVPPAVIAAFWGLESDFGAELGNLHTLPSLVSLAYDCRRSRDVPEGDHRGAEDHRPRRSLAPPR